MGEVINREIDQFIAMLKRAGIAFTQDAEDGFIDIEVPGGYDGFVSMLRFDENTGNLIEVGAFE